MNLVLPVILLHLYASPYTKVEESFNIQAIHDIIKYGIRFKDSEDYFLQYYDHVSFPGSVPRTFVGALTLAEFTAPFIRWCKDAFQVQLLVRGVLGISNAVALWSFTTAIDRAFGRTASYWYILLQVSQFHVMYYASRTLPNMFAFALTTLSQRFYITSNFGFKEKRARQSRLSLYLMTLAGVIFRSELAILVATFSLTFVSFRKTSITRVVIPAGMTAVSIGILATVSIDSFFWQKFPLWPEWVAFRYNTIEGKSSDWGTSPVHYYFTNSLPKLMMNPMSTLVCIPVALAVKTTRRFSLGILLPLLIFVAIYSALPHKEWRFIVYIIPGLTGVASAGASWIWTKRTKSFICLILSVALVASTIASLAASLGLLYISSMNYPGGEALARLHRLADHSRPTVNVYLDNLSCQTGVTRFLQDQRSQNSIAGGQIWSYDKTENKTVLSDPSFWTKFDYILAENPSEIPGGAWDVLDRVECFAGVDLLSGPPPPFDRRSARTSLIMQHRYSDWQIDALVLYKEFEHLARTYITRGRWVAIRTLPRITILRSKQR